MKKFLLIIVIAVAASYFYLEYSAPSRVHVVRIGVECDHAPYNWEEDKHSDNNFPLANNPGHYVDGYDVQIANMAAEELGLKPVFIKVEWDDLINALLRNEIDAIFSGMVDTEERKKLIAFTQPYEVREIEYAVLMNVQSKYINAESIQDLSGAKIIAQKDSRFDDVIDQIPGVVHIAPMNTQAAILEEVRNFRVDGIVINFDTGQSYESRDPNFRVIRFAKGKGFELGFTGLCAGVRKNDKKLLYDMNSAIESIYTRQRQKIMDQAIFRLWENI